MVRKSKVSSTSRTHRLFVEMFHLGPKDSCLEGRAPLDSNALQWCVKMGSAKDEEMGSLAQSTKIVIVLFSVFSLMSILSLQHARDKEPLTNHAQVQNSAATIYTAGLGRKRTWYKNHVYHFTRSS